jgi:Putative transposase of IS4/5 family (DUF4096)
MPAQLFGLWLVPLIPPAKHGGRKRKVDVREVVNGIMYVLSTGCQWRTNADGIGGNEIGENSPPGAAVPEPVPQGGAGPSESVELHQVPEPACRFVDGSEAHHRQSEVDSGQAQPRP